MSAVKVLFVDGEPRILVALERGLREDGFELFFATSGAEASRILDEERVDVVVSDHKISGVSGVELLTEARAAHPSVVRIVMADHIDRDTTIRAINEMQVHRIVEKPMGLTTIRDVLREVAPVAREKRDAAAPNAAAAVRNFGKPL